MKKKFSLFVCLLLLFPSLFGEGFVVAEEAHVVFVSYSREGPTRVLPLGVTAEEMTEEIRDAAGYALMAIDISEAVSANVTANEDWAVCCETDAPKSVEVWQDHSGGNPCSYYDQVRIRCDGCKAIVKRGPRVFAGTHSPCLFFP